MTIASYLLCNYCFLHLLCDLSWLSPYLHIVNSKYPLTNHVSEIVNCVTILSFVYNMTIVAFVHCVTIVYFVHCKTFVTLVYWMAIAYFLYCVTCFF